MFLFKGIYTYNLSIREDPGLKANQGNFKENRIKLTMQRKGRKEKGQEEEEGEGGGGGLEKEQLGQLWHLLYTA